MLPPASPAVNTTRQKLLQQATSTFGAKAVAKELGTTEDVLAIWLNGKAAMPDNKLVRVVDMLDHKKP